MLFEDVLVETSPLKKSILRKGSRSKKKGSDRSGDDKSGNELSLPGSPNLSPMVLPHSKKGSGPDLKLKRVLEVGTIDALPSKKKDGRFKIISYSPSSKKEPQALFPVITAAAAAVDKKSAKKTREVTKYVAESEGVCTEWLESVNLIKARCIQNAVGLEGDAASVRVEEPIQPAALQPPQQPPLQQPSQQPTKSKEDDKKKKKGGSDVVAREKKEEEKRIRTEEMRERKEEEKQRDKEEKEKKKKEKEEKEKLKREQKEKKEKDKKDKKAKESEGEKTREKEPDNNTRDNKDNTKSAEGQDNNNPNNNTIHNSHNEETPIPTASLMKKERHKSIIGGISSQIGSKKGTKGRRLSLKEKKKGVFHEAIKEQVKKEAGET